MKRARGFSLIIVLAALAIMCLLLVALFSGGSHSVRSAVNDANQTRADMLAHSAVALVMGQLQQATTGSGLSWISQPGLLRTFAASSSARTPAACYKLYSSPQMIDTTGGTAFLSTDMPVDWSSTANASVYTDLNAPIYTPGGAALYPILDGRAVTQVTGLSSDSGHAVEMPVQWLYELRDGSLGAISAATTANPIVGRVAFWTDDETSKVNVNTAGAASTWNTPRTSSPDDTGWANTQPASGEFERYPAHPASVALDLLFGADTTANLGGDELLALTPRYNSGGSEFGTQFTTSASSVAAKADRLYNSVDELCFGSSIDSSGQRKANPVTPDEINLNRFVLTAHSHAPETTLLGEPRVAIWPVSDAPADATRTTAIDRAVASDAALGTTNYFFQRHNAASATDDLAPSIVPANASRFSALVGGGSAQLPGCSSTFAQKYPGTQWAQLMLEIVDAIRGFNSIDPAAGSVAAPTSFVPFAAGDSAGGGRGLIVPLTTTSGSTTLRGLGRYPTLFGLTLVLYVSGYVFTDGTSIDYEKTPDYAPGGSSNGASWQTNFAPGAPGSRWKQVSKALVRAFIVPTTFQTGCGYPEVSDACSIRISGLNTLGATAKSTSGTFGFAPACTSRLLSDALTVAPADRAWGGFEGPLAWRAASIDATSGSAGYAFAGTQAVTLPINTAGTDGSLSTSWPSLTVSGPTTLTVQILDRNGNTLQTAAVSLPSISGHVPTINGEADHADGSTPATSTADWATSAASAVLPSYYMTLRNRLLATQRSRPLMIQAGDLSYSVEAHTDLRLIAALPSVPANFYAPLPTSWATISTTQGGTHRHDLRFADGTSACFCETQGRTLVSGAAYANTASSFTVTDWRNGSTVLYPFATSLPPSGPTDPTYVSMAAPGATSAIYGDWDTGPGFGLDGALTAMPDEGTTLDPAKAYQSLGGGQAGAATCRSPNALIPSPVVFGSLPAGVNPAQPAQSFAWRTLLFCPYPSGDQLHPGHASPPDYLLLDKFWMPVVEPYAISTRFETAGKINLNDQIAPFTYLHRSTALHALLHGLRIPAISPAYSSTFKTLPPPASFSPWRPVDEDATIAQIESRFASGDAYLTEGEICSLPLIPTMPVGTASQSPEVFWTNHSTGLGSFTGDNLRELPYAQIYSRLTTRSNSYTVHLRAQVLQKRNDHSNPAVWRESVDHVVAEWRGSYEIERYLDPAASAPAAGAPLGPYKFRVVSAQRFSP